MKRIIIKTIIVLFGLAIVDIIVQIACNKMFDALDNESECRVGSLAIENHNLNVVTCDLLLVGSSPTTCGLDSKLIRDSLCNYTGKKWKVSNVGRSQSEIPYKYSVIMSAIDRKPPKAIILDLNSYFSLTEEHSKGLVSVIRPYYYRNKYVKEVLDEYDIPRERLLYKISSLYRFRGYLISLPIQFIKPFGGDGFMPNYSTLPSTAESFIGRDSAKVDKSIVKYLNKIIDACKTNNILLVITITPKYVCSDANCDSYRAIVKICNENNIPFIDMENDNRFRDYRLYYDRYHLNYKGAEIYSTIICRELKNIMNETKMKN